MRPLRAALQWMRSEGVLVVFISAAISHPHMSEMQVSDLGWNPSIV
jgi:hypothetical protein